MDLRELVHALQGTMHPEEGIRKAAEAALSKASSLPGFVSGLLQLTVMPDTSLDVRQMASIQLKNTVIRHWEIHSDGTSELPDADRATVRANIIPCIIQSPHLVRAQLVETAREVINEDYPGRWPELLDVIDGHLSSGDQGTVHGVLFACRLLCRRYEFKDEEERSGLDEVVARIFPKLLLLLRELLSQPWAALAQADMIKLVLKSFWSANYLHVPKPLVDASVFLPWLESIVAVIQHPVPEGQPEDLDERKRWSWWKVKKWAMHIAGRLISRLGDQSSLTQEEDQAASALFLGQCILPLTQVYLQIASELSRGTYMHPRCISQAITYLSEAAIVPQSYEVMKPHMESLVLHVVFPLLCFSDEDRQLWEEDPQEYVRKGYDVIEDLYSEKNAATVFLIEVAEKRPKAHLGMILGHVARVFGEFTAAGSGATEAQARRMDGALLAVGALATVLRKKKAYKGSIEPMILQHVMPCFQNPHGFLRAKACWVAHSFADVRFRDGRGKGPTFSALCENVMRCLGDPEMPVRVDACIALSDFVECIEDVRVLHPILPQLLQSIFALMAEVEHEELVTTLETIVERLGSAIAPYAVDLSRQLCEALAKLVSADDDENEAGIMAAYGCVRAMSTVVDAVSDLPELIPQLEEVFFPVLKTMLSGVHGDDLMEEVLELLSYLTFYSTTLSPRMWELWPILLDVLLKISVDYFNRVLPCLDNFISKGKEAFLSNPYYLSSTHDLARWALENDDFDESTAKNAAKLLEAVLQQCRGHVNSSVGPFLRMVYARLQKPFQQASFQDSLMLVVFNALYYDPALTLRELEGMGALGPVFTMAAAMVRARKSKRPNRPQHFRDEYSKKVVCLGLTALMTVDDASLPAAIGGSASLGVAFEMLLQLLGFLKDDMERARLEEEASSGSGSDGDDDEDLDDGYGEEDGALGEDVEVQDVQLSKLVRRLQGGDQGSNSDDTSDWEWEEEAEVFSCPLDDIDAFVQLADCMEAMRGLHPARFEALTGKPELQGALQEVSLYADKRRQEIAAEKAAEQEEEAKKQAKRMAGQMPPAGQ